MSENQSDDFNKEEELDLLMNEVFHKELNKEV